MVSREQITSIAASALATLSAFASFYVYPYFEAASPSMRFLGSLLTALIFMLIQRILRRIHYGPILGEWYYVTVAAQGTGSSTRTLPR